MFKKIQAILALSVISVATVFSFSINVLADDLSIDLISYISGGTTSSTQILSDGSILFGGDYGLIRVSADGSTIIDTEDSVIVNDIDSEDNSSVFLATSAGVYTYDSGSSTLSGPFTSCLGNNSKVSISNEGTAFIQGNSICTLYNATSSTFSIPQSNPADVAMLGSTVYVTGYDQVSANLQVPFISAYELDGTLITTATFGSGTADTRGVAISVGEDGNLYFAGTTDGGNNPFENDPNIVNLNEFTNTSNSSGAKKFTYYARLNPDTLEREISQFIVSRLSSGGANSVEVKDITADANGNIYLALQSFASFSGRGNATINGQPIDAYSGGEAILFRVNPTLTTWDISTPLPAGGASDSTSTIVAVDTFGGIVSFAGNTEGSIQTVNSIIDATSGSFFALLGTDIISTGSSGNGGGEENQSNNRQDTLLTTVRTGGGAFIASSFVSIVFIVSGIYALNSLKAKN